MRLRDVLRQQYTFADIHPAVINGQHYFRVRAGKFDSLAAAEQERTRMLAEGFGNGFVVALD
jgi:rare lipoprotein A